MTVALESLAMSAHRPYFVIRNPATGQIRKIGYASAEDGMQQVLLTDGSTQAALDHPATVFLSAKKRAGSAGRGRRVRQPKE